MPKSSLQTLLLLLLFSIPIALCVSYPECNECRSPERIIAPGIGMELTHEYGSAAIRHQNGSMVYLGKVYGGEAYHSMMNCRSLELSRLEEPHDFWSRVRYNLERQRRAWNKRLGRPATNEVGIIASVLADLRSLCTNHLGHPITDVVISRPSLPGFDPEDIPDALEYVGLAPIQSFESRGVDISTIVAVYAATGKGLCEHPEDVVSCEKEHMPGHYLLSINFANALLSLSLGHISHATAYWEFASTVRTDMGLAARSDYADDDTYWEALRDVIWRFIMSRDPEVLELLQIYGEKAADEKFQKALKAALSGLRPHNRGAWSQNLGREVHPLELAARGTAELAKRFQEMTNGCVEPRRCFESEGATQMHVFDL